MKQINNKNHFKLDTFYLVYKTKETDMHYSSRYISIVQCVELKHYKWLDSIYYANAEILYRMTFFMKSLTVDEWFEHNMTLRHPNINLLNEFNDYEIFELSDDEVNIHIGAMQI